MHIKLQLYMSRVFSLTADENRNLPNPFGKELQQTLPFNFITPLLGMCCEKIIQNMEKFFYTKMHIPQDNSLSKKHWNSNRYLKCPLIVKISGHSFG